MQYLSSVYFVNQSLRVSGIFVVHHQEVYYIYNNWYVMCFLVDCLLANPANTQSAEVKYCIKLVFITHIYRDARSTKCRKTYTH